MFLLVQEMKKAPKHFYCVFVEADSDKVVLRGAIIKKTFRLVTACYKANIKVRKYRGWYEVIMTCRGTFISNARHMRFTINGNFLFTHSYWRKMISFVVWTFILKVCARSDANDRRERVIKMCKNTLCKFSMRQELNFDRKSFQCFCCELWVDGIDNGFNDF